MKKTLLFSLSAALLLILIASACTRVAFTGRRQLSLVSDAEITTMGLQSYKEFMATAKISGNKQYNTMIRNVGQRLSTSVSKYMQEHGMAADLSNYAWEFSVVQDSQANAFCMPGGKIVFYEGIMPYCTNENYVAVVMSHEIAHAVAKHAQERASQSSLVNTGATILGQALAGQSALTQSLAASVYGLGANVGMILPYSRKHEYEADKLGLIFMAIAGYDVNKAVDFWTAMSKGKAGAPPAFLSTHPSDQSRIDAIKKEIPGALTYKQK